MQKDYLKSLVTQMYYDLIKQIDEHDNATKEQVTNYLIEAANTISNFKEKELDSAGQEQATFSNAYQDVATNSLSSYTDSNIKFQQITQMQEETLSEFKKPQIDLNSISEKFDEIRSHMTDEVNRANEVIHQLTEQVKDLEEKSNIDPLTKVFNRRALTSYLNNICSHDTIPHKLHLLILDLDDFKVINDVHGHIAGDKILIFVANILRQTLRDGDKIFRFGGEEFIIILNRIDNTECKAITNRLIKLVNSNILVYKDNKLRITTSIGATKYEKGDTADSIISRADKALYKAKKNGKNQMYSEVKNGI
ncbi:GGDEF domain-containing protein [bacterium]|nr:GGDEF domain-containing protein [bacterium]MBU1991304.1 GGDEF domain-containing protein [bacterium]